jgi:pilus assembly protein Flp/PilA
MNMLRKQRFGTGTGIPDAMTGGTVASVHAASLTAEKDNFMNLMKRLWNEEEGQDLVEYALLVVLISLAAVAAMKGLASGISDAFSNAAANLT